MSELAKGPEALRRNVGKLTSEVGGFVPGSHAIFRGCDLHRDLKDMDWMSLYVFGITGRRFSAPQIRLMNAIWTYTSYPDARLWNNRVAALAGSSRSTGTLGVSAALAVSEASIYGRGVDVRAIQFQLGCRKHVDGGGSIEEFARRELAERRSIAGYGRPLTSADERIAPIMALARELGLDKGRHLALAGEIERILHEGRWRLRMNYAGVAAALAADMGFTPRQYYLFGFPAFLAGMIPCFVEAADRTEGILFPLSCDHIAYEGIEKRRWPK